MNLNEKRIKHWPINKFIDLANKIKAKNKTPVFFIEKKNVKLKNKIQELIPYSLFPEHEGLLCNDLQQITNHELVCHPHKLEAGRL